MGRGVLVASAHRQVLQNYQEGWLRRGGIDQRNRGQGSFNRFMRILQYCLVGRCIRIRFARGRGQSGALDGRRVCASGGRRWLG